MVFGIQGSGAVERMVASSAPAACAWPVPISASSSDACTQKVSAKSGLPSSSLMPAFNKPWHSGITRARTLSATTVSASASRAGDTAARMFSM